MKKNSILLISAMIVFASCERFPSVGDGYKQQLGANGYRILTDTLNTIIISGHILESASNDTFILVYQKPVYKICECNYECFMTMDSYDKQSYKRCKEAFKESVLRQYWIINKLQESIFDSHTKTRSNVYGPYSYDDYLKKKVELGVLENLNLVIEDKLVD